MRFTFASSLGLGLVVLAAVTASSSTAMHAQAPAAPKPRAAAPAARPANVLQVMRGVLYPASNVVFFAQSEDPTAVPKPKDPSLATNPLASTYGGWEAVANASVALSEAARLLEVPRACSNGKPAPITAATWKQGLSELRAAGAASLAAARAKNQDQIIDAADKITTACSTCHEKYREAPTRCVP